jgi:hypothetical protein
VILGTISNYRKLLIFAKNMKQLTPAAKSVGEPPGARGKIGAW